MKKRNTVLLVDGVINLLLGAILLAYSAPVIDLFGLPATDLYFYPNILGAILAGIGVALVIEYTRKDTFTGLGLGGAISINMAGGIVLFLWLVSGNLDIPLKGVVILWVLDILLVGISTVEMIVHLKKNRTDHDS